MGAGGITYTAERDETVDFTQLFQTYDQTMLVREGEKIASILWMNCWRCLISS